MRSYIKYGISYGMISAILCILFFYSTLLFGNDPLGGSKAISYFFMLIIFFLVLWNFRRDEKQGVLHFHQGFFVVLVEHTVSCLLFALFVWASLMFFNPTLLDKHKEESTIFWNFIKPALIKTIGEKGFSKGLEDINMMTPTSLALDEFKKRFSILIFFVLIASFIMRRSPNTISKMR